MVFAASDVLAAGTIKLKSSEVTEVSGAWHLYVKIELSKAPSIPHVPMRFVFTKTMVYERALIDGHSDPVVNRTALSNQTPSTESLDVDFANAQGKIFKGTNFDFDLTRTRGYEAGEYKLQIRTADGVDVGSSVNVVLKGDNPVVDRRSLTFDASKKPIQKVDNGVDAGPKNGPDESQFAAPTSGDVVPAGSAAPFIPQDAYNATPEEQGKDHPKGCGCSLPGTRTEDGLALFASLGFVGLVFARRRRSN
ncbi:MAG TPA: MYXO-CTERM sorting domain-containing protein [Polyangiaceae bacterium]